MQLVFECIKAFAVGGAICAVGQLLIDKTGLTPARILTALVVLGVILGGLGIYKHVVDFAGGGATVPLLGFGYALANGTREGVEQYGLLGALTGGISSCSAGISAAVVFGFLAALIFRPSNK